MSCMQALNNTCQFLERPKDSSDEEDLVNYTKRYLNINSWRVESCSFGIKNWVNNRLLLWLLALPSCSITECSHQFLFGKALFQDCENGPENQVWATLVTSPCAFDRIRRLNCYVLKHILACQTWGNTTHTGVSFALGNTVFTSLESGFELETESAVCSFYT